ncbi:MAG: hypothetical protein M1382_01805 [Candidatus Marsarchaeota archaeon]|nr:hypothetical protein [Candidatus Marsarchaeota archaeon]
METKEMVNISVDRFVDIYERLKRVFDKDVVVIGGRAVNLYCFKDTRKTNNINMVVYQPDISMKELDPKLIKNDFVRDFSDSKNLLIMDIKDKILGVEVNVHYSGLLNDVPLSHVIKYANNYQIITTKGNYQIKIASIPTIIALKATGRTKDNKDIRDLLNNYYNGNANEFLENERTKEEYAKFEESDISKIKKAVLGINEENLDKENKLKDCMKNNWRVTFEILKREH